jgi:hypothetical protein
MNANDIVNRLLEEYPQRDIPAPLAQWLTANGAVRRWIFDPYDEKGNVGAYAYLWTGQKMSLEIKPSFPDQPEQVDIDIRVYDKHVVTSVDKNAKQAVRFIQLLISRYEK